MPARGAPRTETNPGQYQRRGERHGLAASTQTPYGKYADHRGAPCRSAGAHLAARRQLA
ncbi:protein of unknown function [Paraburkholderia kururiensis]